jgi:NAD(P)H-hydrate epimerase
MALSRAQVRRVDELAVRELGLAGVVLMENAGRNAADAIRERLAGWRAARVVLFCGPGNNGGDGFVIARHLTIPRSGGGGARVAVKLFLAGERARVAGDAAANLRVIERLGLEVREITTIDAARAAVAELRSDDVVVDALLGTGFTGSVREPMATLITALDAAKRAALVAVDLPSGLDCDTGAPSNATLHADLTITFVDAKTGFLAPGAVAFTGEVLVRDIGVPPALIDRARG